MKIKLNSQQGFTPFAALLVIVIVLGISGVGYYVYHQNHKGTGAANTSANPQSANTVQAGTTAAIDSLTSQDSKAEDAIDAKYQNSDQTTVKSANGAAANLNGAYDESTY